MSAALPYTKRTLENGLDVIVHEEHACPVVAINLWYHVGSKNERPGRTGYAHLFEHLMFEGSAHHDRGYFRPLEEAGGALNGSTSSDRTNYWATVPPEAVERALWLESDRMGYLLPALTAAKLDTQRDVVLNERRQNYENRPYGLAMMALAAAHFPASHPYHWPTIGMPADLRAVRLGDMREFFATYYHPGNASLAIAGDIATDRALALAARYFRRDPVRPPAAAGGRSRRRRGSAAPLSLPRGSGGARARLSHLAHGGVVRGRRRGAGSAGRGPGGRAVVPPPPRPGSGPPAGDGRQRLAGFPRGGGACS